MNEYWFKKLIKVPLFKFLKMNFSQKIKHKQFWISFAKVTIPFFLFLVVISILFNSFSALFSGDFETVSKINFDDGKWIPFFSIKIVASVLYGFYTANKNFKKIKSDF